jgi:hypothetical protein
MNRVIQVDPAQATGKTKQLFEAVQTKLGVVPNLFRVLGVSPAALEGYLNFGNDRLGRVDWGLVSIPPGIAVHQ